MNMNSVCVHDYSTPCGCLESIQFTVSTVIHAVSYTCIEVHVFWSPDIYFLVITSCDYL